MKAIATSLLILSSLSAAAHASEAPTEFKPGVEVRLVSETATEAEYDIDLLEYRNASFLAAYEDQQGEIIKADDETGEAYAFYIRKAREICKAYGMDDIASFGAGIYTRDFVESMGSSTEFVKMVYLDSATGKLMQKSVEFVDDEIAADPKRGVIQVFKQLGCKKKKAASEPKT